jgi:hypothetical protein
MMNKTINIKIKYLLVFAVVFLLLIIATFSKPKADIIETNKTTTTTKIKKVDSAKVDVSIKEPINTIVFLVDTITGKAKQKPRAKSDPRKANSEKPIKPTEKEVKANVFTETFNLKNGKAKVTVIAPERIFSIDLKMITEDVLIETETSKKVTKFVNENVWFANVSPKFLVFPQPTFTGIEFSIDYTIKNKLRFGAGIEFNNQLPINSQFVFNLKLGIRL